MSKTPDFSRMVPLPHNPAYLVDVDGRVYSHKKGGYLSETRPRYSVNWRVRIGHREFRVRDMVELLHGSSYRFEERAEEWIEEHYPDEDEVLA